MTSKARLQLFDPGLALSIACEWSYFADLRRHAAWPLWALEKPDLVLGLVRSSYTDWETDYELSKPKKDMRYRIKYKTMLMQIAWATTEQDKHFWFAESLRASISKLVPDTHKIIPLLLEVCDAIQVGESGSRSLLTLSTRCLEWVSWQPNKSPLNCLTDAAYAVVNGRVNSSMMLNLYAQFFDRIRTAHMIQAALDTQCPDMVLHNWFPCVEAEMTEYKAQIKIGRNLLDKYIDFTEVRFDQADSKQ